MSYCRRETRAARLADRLSKIKRLAPVSSIRLVRRCGHHHNSFQKNTPSSHGTTPACKELVASDSDPGRQTTIPQCPKPLPAVKIKTLVVICQLSIFFGSPAKIGSEVISFGNAP